MLKATCSSRVCALLFHAAQTLPPNRHIGGMYSPGIADQRSFPTYGGIHKATDR
jgi:hypothetical protein